MIELFAQHNGEESCLAVTLAWYSAVRSKDLEKALELCHADVELGWSRGLGRGADLLPTWLKLAGDIEFRRAFQRRTTVVFERTAQDAERKTASRAVLFEVDGSLLRRIIRYRALADALREGHMTEGEEVRRLTGCKAGPPAARPAGDFSDAWPRASAR